MIVLRIPKIISVVGARPQFIKAALVSKRLRQLGVREILIHTGQHYDFEMSEIFFQELGIPKPDHFLGIGGLSHGKMTGRMIEKLEEVFGYEKPKLVVVYGDTNSTLAGALAAVKLHIPVAHVEAGMRSFRFDMPEEINRVLTDRISTLLFCSTRNAFENLKREGFPFAISKSQKQRIYITGDVMKDTLLLFKKFAKKPEFDIPQRYAIATIHREENTDNA
ncbi:MAG: UDP-N-acetyl glucosamine 2-epimerase, partial [Candidatus Calescibacterium sp.]|nr:UDP-N-acetyl glucosamine 2-epimerase [Candidatus Calescibacterium sp.]